VTVPNPAPHVTRYYPPADCHCGNHHAPGLSQAPPEYCKIISQSTFTLCYRGYGLNSFRIKEALQLGSIPVYISDEFIEAHNIPIDTYGVKITEADLPNMHDILTDVLLNELSDKPKETDMDKLGFSYEGCYQKIIQHLETGA
jgi:hypothetical protein